MTTVGGWAVVQVGGCLNKQPGMWKCRQADGLVGNSDDWVDRKAGDGAEDLGGWEARRQGHVWGVGHVGRQAWGRGGGRRQGYFGRLGGRQARSVYFSIPLLLHLHRYLVPSQLTFTQWVDFGW